MKKTRKVLIPKIDSGFDDMMKRIRRFTKPRKRVILHSNSKWDILRQNDMLYCARVNKMVSDTELSKEEYEKEYLGTFDE